MQNTSHAVMAQRIEPRDSFDNFPTPPWATRALIEHIILEDLRTQTCLEPACGAGHMARVLDDYFLEVEAQDIADYGYGRKADFLEHELKKDIDWVITNPPFRLAEKFIEKSLKHVNRGCAFLVRTTFLESVGRYNRLFKDNPPSLIAQFVERVPMVKGRLDRKASTATGYCWLVWYKNSNEPPALRWIPPCRRQLERDEDYGSTNVIVDLFY